MQIAPGYNFHDNQNTDTLHNSLQPELRGDIQFSGRREIFVKFPENGHISWCSQAPTATLWDVTGFWGAINNSFQVDQTDSIFTSTKLWLTHTSMSALLLILCFSWGQRLEIVSAYPCCLFDWSIVLPSSCWCVSNLGGHSPEQSGPHTKFCLRGPHMLPYFAACCSGKQPELHSENLTQRSIRLLWLILTLLLGSGL